MTKFNHQFAHEIDAICRSMNEAASKISQQLMEIGKPPTLEDCSRIEGFGQCWSCKYWSSNNNNIVDAECKRHAPVPMLILESIGEESDKDTHTFYRCVWPKPVANDSCGDFVAADPSVVWDRSGNCFR